MKRFLWLVICVFLIAAVSGCGKENETTVESVSVSAETAGEVSAATVSDSSMKEIRKAEIEKWMDIIPGQYFSHPINYGEAEFKALEVKGDGTLLINGANEVTYQVEYDDDLKLYAVSFSLDGFMYEYELQQNEKDYVFLTGINGEYGTYVRPDDFYGEAAEMIKSYKGSYISEEIDAVVCIDDDLKFEHRGEKKPIIAFWNSRKDKMEFYVDNNTLVLSDGGIKYCSRAYKAVGDIEYVDITPENFWEYFEWDQEFSLKIEYNAFNEPEQIWASKYLRLKDEYAKRLIKPMSSVAIEYEYDDNTYSTYVAYNSEDGSYTYWTEGKVKHYYTEPISNIVDDLIQDSLEDGETVYYICAWGASIFSAHKDGNIYSEGPKLTDFGLYDTLRVLRSNTTLVFKSE